MLCRVVFPNNRKFASLAIFFDAVKKLVAQSPDKYDANFFLFGEDILGLVDKALIRNPFEQSIVSHELALSFIPRLQKILGPNNFVIFSFYSTFGDFVVNSVYFVGSRQWFFDIKRNLAGADRLVIAKESRQFHALHSRLNAKTPICAKSGSMCLKNLYVFVCADIDLLKEVRLAGNSLLFIPACGLPEYRIKNGFHALRGSGRAFINDPYKGITWDIQFGKNTEAKASTLRFGARSQICIDFEQ